MRRRLTLLLCIAILLGLCAFGTSCSGVYKVGFLYPGSATDDICAPHEQARIALETTLEVQTYVEENVSAGQECLVHIEQLVKSGCKLIYAVSPSYAPYAQQAALKYPDVTFLQYQGTQTEDNLFGYDVRSYQAWYLSGLIAGNETELNKVGFIGGEQNGIAVTEANAFALGVKKANPDAKVFLKWTGSSSDTNGDAAATRALLGMGCDILAQQTNTDQPVRIAEENNVLFIGSMADELTKGYLTGPAMDADDLYLELTRKAMQSGLEEPFIWQGIKKDSTVLIPYGEKVSEESMSLVKDACKILESGSGDVFCGPIYQQNGELMIAPGEKMTDEELLQMNFLVEPIVSVP